MEKLVVGLIDTALQTAFLDLECRTLREHIARLDGMFEATKELRRELEREPQQSLTGVTHG